jgi:ATP diphosphatase
MDNVARLLVLMAHLRDPVQGCPWDLQQTFASIAPHTLEEVYGVIDAIERGDFQDLKEELGDLLFQVVYYAQMANEQDLFDFDQIAKSIGDKLVRRHPHVFGDAQLPFDQARTKAWEAEKARERLAEAANAQAPSTMDGVAQALPALTRARKLQQRAAGKGFDWPDQSGVLAKIEEELTEVRLALAEKEGNDRIKEELGDLLFAVVNLSRWAGTDPEGALRAANDKFERRFRQMELRLADQNRRPEACTLEELDALWERVKQEERVG